jgi:hypothetical protein
MVERRKAAPMEMASLGRASVATGRPNSEAINDSTSGNRDDPPTSNTAERSATVIDAESMARRKATMVSSRAGRIMASSSARVSCT